MGEDTASGGTRGNVVTMASTTLASNNNNNLGGDHEHATSDTTTVVPPQPAPALPAADTNKKRRQRFGYSMKLFYANMEIYLERNPTFPPPESTPELVGMVRECPTRNNGNMYHIQWISPRLDGMGWPENLQYHLRTKFDKIFLNKKHNLKGLIESCSLNLDGKKSKNKSTTTMPAPPTIMPPPMQLHHHQQTLMNHATAVATAAAATTTTPTVPPAAAVAPVVPIIDMEIVNTPAAQSMQRKAFASLHTAGSASGYTEISSLGNSNRSQAAAPPRAVRKTRSTVDEYDTDDADTEGEAEYEMNLQDGLWNIMTNQDEDLLRRIRINELNVSDEDDENTSHVSTASPIGTASVSAAVPDYGTLLQNCTDFHFEEIKTKSEAEEWMRAHPPPKIYDGESGLKRGVAASFETPLGALRKAGLTPELVARYTYNSNR